MPPEPKRAAAVLINFGGQQMTLVFKKPQGALPIYPEDPNGPE
jgi:hypothetical protein